MPILKKRRTAVSPTTLAFVTPIDDSTYGLICMLHCVFGPNDDCSTMVKTVGS